MFALFITILLSGNEVFSLIESHGHILSADANNPDSVCKKIHSLLTSHYVPYVETYRARSPLGDYRVRTRINYRIENQTTWKTEDVCCSGYTQFQKTCIPVCEKTCELGFCYKPDVCHCLAGYAKTPGKPENVCSPVCENECIQGFCDKPNNCTCLPGYKLENDGFTCVPVCESPCSETEFCAEPNDCRCIPGYKRPSSGNSTLPSENSNTLSHKNTKENCEAVCEMPCVHGDCVAPDTCTCHDGYGKFDDASFDCVPVCNQTCHFGSCTSPGVCTCSPGYAAGVGVAANVCEPVCSEPCINGICVAPETCACNEPYILFSDSKNECKPTCKDNCTNGNCSQLNICTCNPGYKYNETTRGCTFNCNCNNGFCKEPDSTCICNEGYTWTKTENATFCAPKCDDGCVNGMCTAPQVCECPKDHVLVNDTGSLSRCVNPCETCVNGACSSGDKFCQCYRGWNGSDCNVAYLCMIGFVEMEHRERIQNITTIHDLDQHNVHIPQNYLPACSSQCRSEISNTTDCFTSSGSNSSNVTCFLGIDSNCNQRQTISEKRESKGRAPIFLGLLSLVFGIAATILGLHIKRRNAAKKRFVADRISVQQRESTDCLLEEDESTQF